MSCNAHVPFLLLKARMDTDTREIARHKEFIQFDGASNRFDEDDDLYEH